VANGKVSRAHVWLALASALVVLLASGVAISRISEQDDESPVATGPSSTSSSLPGLGQPGPAVGSGPASAAGVGGVAEQATPVPGEAASGESPVTHGVTRTARNATGSASGSGASNATTGGATPSGSGSPEGAGAAGGGSSGGGQGSPPAPSQNPPGKTPLAAASVSLGQGAEGAVVGLGLGNDSLADADVTVGTNPLVGDHPPSEGTGVTFGGRLLPG
jgi:hypothetical protein